VPSCLSDKSFEFPKNILLASGIERDPVNVTSPVLVIVNLVLPVSVLKIQLDPLVK
jgi:hypothetical protein